MSTPEILAIRLPSSPRALRWASALSLFVTRVGADDHDPPVAADHFTLLAHLLDAWSDLHGPYSLGKWASWLHRTESPKDNHMPKTLLVPVGDTTSTEVIWGQLNLNPVTRKDPDVVHPHLSGDMGQHGVAVFEFHAKHGVGKRFDHFALKNNGIFFGLRQRPDLRLYSRPWTAQGRAAQAEGVI